MSVALDAETATFLDVDFDANVPCQTTHSVCTAPAEGVLIFRCCKRKFTLCIHHHEAWVSATAMLMKMHPRICCRYCHHVPLVTPDWVLL